MDFLEIDRQLAEQQHVPLADMAALEADYLQTLGPEKTAAFFPIDHTHNSPEGAEMNARLVADALKNLHSPVSSFIRKQ